jgi:hypothetical protein
MGLLSVILSGGEESQFYSERFSASAQIVRFSDFARNDKFMCRTPLGWMPDKMRMGLTK